MAFTFRIPDDLDERVTSEAEANRRSKNQQLLRILEERYGLTDDSTDIQPRVTSHESREPVAA